MTVGTRKSSLVRREAVATTEEGDDTVMAGGWGDRSSRSPAKRSSLMTEISPIKLPGSWGSIAARLSLTLPDQTSEMTKTDGTRYVTDSEISGVIIEDSGLYSKLIIKATSNLVKSFAAVSPYQASKTGSFASWVWGDQGDSERVVNKEFDSAFRGVVDGIRLKEVNWMTLIFGPNRVCFISRDEAAQLDAIVTDTSTSNWREWHELGIHFENPWLEREAAAEKLLRVDSEEAAETSNRQDLLDLFVSSKRPDSTFNYQVSFGTEQTTKVETACDRSVKIKGDLSVALLLDWLRSECLEKKKFPTILSDKSFPGASLRLPQVEVGSLAETADPKSKSIPESDNLMSITFRGLFTGFMVKDFVEKNRKSKDLEISLSLWSPGLSATIGCFRKNEKNRNVLVGFKKQKTESWETYWKDPLKLAL